MNAITKMESQQPLLALCAAHWKADHVLGNTLLATPATDSVDSDDSGSVSINAAPSQLSKHKKKSSNDLEACKKKKQKMEKTVMSKKTEDEGSGKESGVLVLYPIVMSIVTLTYIVEPTAMGSTNMGETPTNPQDKTIPQQPPPKNSKSKKFSAVSFLGGGSGPAKTQPTVVDTSFVQIDASCESSSLLFST